MFDSHCHLDFEELACALPSELGAARALGIEGWLVPGCEPAQWSRLAHVSAQAGVSVAVGVHPWWVPELAARGPSALGDAVAELESAARSLGAVALGECGLDAARVDRNGPELELQRTAFEAQLEVARDVGLPVVLHVVRAHEAALASLRRLGVPAAGGVVHGFSGSLGLAEEYTRLGLYVGIGCQVTSTASRKLREVAARLPLERLLIETDAPDQRPRSTRALAARGRPVDLALVAEAVAALRGMDASELGRATARNARRLLAV